MNSNGKFQRFSSASELRSPVHLAKQMFQDLAASRSLAMSLLRRDLSAQYRQSLLGISWAFIPSIVTALTFSFASRNRIIQIDDTGIPYVAFVVFGVALWQTFSEAVLGPILSLTSAKSYITKINFRHEALFVAKFGEGIFNFMIKASLIVAVFVIYKVPVSSGTVLALGLVLVMQLLGMSIGLLLAPLSLVFQDIIKGVPLLLALGMFVTPVVYPMPKTESVAASLIGSNPLTYLISGIRDLTLHGSTGYGSQLFVIAVVTLLFFAISWLVFRLAIPYVIERCN